MYQLQIVWGQLSFILETFGNGFVLYATVARNAIKLDKMSVWIIKNLAVADICNCWMVMLPILMTQYGSMNQTYCIVLGCYVRAQSFPRQCHVVQQIDEVRDSIEELGLDYVPENHCNNYHDHLQLCACNLDCLRCRRRPFQDFHRRLGVI